MRSSTPSPRLFAGLIVASLTALVSAAYAGSSTKGPKPVLLQNPDATGTLATYATAGAPSPTNAFFQSLGSNGRTCASCHDQSTAWSLTPELAQAKFDASGGQDPLFSSNDGTNSPLVDRSTPAARQAASSMLLTKGLIRVGLPIPDGAEFVLDSVDDPYGYASATELSLFRRPLPATNLRLVKTVMWDARESQVGLSLADQLKNQASHATTGHAQAAAAPSDAQLTQIVQFESGLYTAQLVDKIAGPLSTSGGLGGPVNLSKKPIYVVSLASTRATAGGGDVFALFNKWIKSKGNARNQARGSIARGQALFNTRTFNIRDVAGLNSVQGQEVITGTCATCHNLPNAGGSSFQPMNIGVGQVILHRTPDEPLYTFRNVATNETVSLSDPGRALISGKWEDMGKFKTPGLRGLAARAPYFHNGSAATLDDVLDFYDRRFGIGLNPTDKADLSAFLNAL